MGCKVTIIGAGSVGATIAYTLSGENIASEIVMIDINKEKVEGEVMDIEQGTCFRSPVSLTAGDYADAKETAEILLEGRNIPLYEDQRIQEISFGSYEGMSCIDKTKEENLAFQKFFQDTGNYIPPEDAESVQQLYERTGEFLKSLAENEKLKDKNLLISTHGAAMTAMLNRMRGSLSVEHFWKNEVPPNCSVTIAELEGSGFKIIREGIIFYKEEVKHWKAV